MLLFRYGEVDFDYKLIFLALLFLFKKQCV